MKMYWYTMANANVSFQFWTFAHDKQEHGAAFETGGLEVGQLILEVDDNKVEGMHHQVCIVQTHPLRRRISQRCLYQR